MLVATQRFTALFAGVFAILTGYGLTASLISLNLGARGLGPWVGVVGAAYFVGLGLGSLRAERVIADVGYLRAYGMLTATACLGVLAVALFEHPLAWALARCVQGVALGGLFVCIESWMGSSSEASSRGGLLAVYQVVIYLGLLLGQALLGSLASDIPRAMVVAAMALCVAALPVGAIRQEPPRIIVMPRLRLGELWGWASIGVAGSFVSGVTTGAVYTVAPAAGVDAGLTDGQVGWLMSAFIGGGMLFQLPLGRASDTFDRRVVLGGVALLAAVGGILSMITVGSPTSLIAVAAVQGAGIFAIYTISLAYTYDRVPDERIVSANATLLAVFCIGSGVGSVGSSTALDLAGALGFFVVLALPSAALAVMAFRAARLYDPLPDDQQSEAHLVPRTSPALVEFDPRVDLVVASGVEVSDADDDRAPRAVGEE